MCAGRRGRDPVIAPQGVRDKEVDRLGDGWRVTVRGPQQRGDVMSVAGRGRRPIAIDRAAATMCLAIGLGACGVDRSSGASSEAEGETGSTFGGLSAGTYNVRQEVP